MIYDHDDECNDDHDHQTGEEEGVQGYKYTCEPGDVDWTPMNSNLHMQSIKVFGISGCCIWYLGFCIWVLGLIKFILTGPH